MSVRLREYRPLLDRSYVASTWVSALRSDVLRGTRLTERAELDVGSLDGYHGSLVDRVLSTPDIELRVAALDEDDRMIAGWVASTPVGRRSSVLHFVYVRAPHRRQGVARRLLEAAGVRQMDPLVHTFRTSMLVHVAKHHPTSVLLDPEECLRP